MAGQRASTLIAVDDSAFLAKLSLAFAELRLESETQLLAKAIEVTNWAKMYCPVDTGNLRASINNTAVLHNTAASAYVIVGTSTIYAPYVEFGTWKMHAQPYLRPALAQASGGAFKLMASTALAPAA